MTIDHILGKWKRDKLRKNIPKSSEYVTYEVDSNGKLLRTSECVDGKPVFETYIIREINEEYSIIFLNKNPVSLDNIRVLYCDNKIIRFDIIGTAYIISDVYTYQNDSEILCNNYYYVPNLHNSDKSIASGNPNSPMIQNNYRIFIDSEGYKHVEIDSEEKSKNKNRT